MEKKGQVLVSGIPMVGSKHHSKFHRNGKEVIRKEVYSLFF